MNAAEADIVHEHQHGLDILRVVLDQVVSVGHDALAATVSHAIVVQERKCRGTKRSSDAVARAMEENYTSAVAGVAAARTIVAKADFEAKRARRTVQQLQGEHDRLQAATVALQKASTVVECLDAVKKYETEDLGQGHLTGGTAAHRANRMQVLERIRRKFPPLPFEQQNDWEWFKVRWDKHRLLRMHHLNRNAWGSEFRNEMLELLKQLKDGKSDALQNWMAKQSRLHLAMPALCV
jgi:hypothetical protein